MASLSVGICDLPDEVLCEIFSKLTPKDVFKYVINVCKRWNAVVKENKIFWGHIQLTINCDNFIDCSYFSEETVNSNHSLQALYPNELFIGEKDLEKVSSLRCVKLTDGAKAESLPALLLIRILDIISKTCKKIEKVEFERCFGATSIDFFQLLRERYSNISDIRFGVNCSYIIPYNEISKFTNLTTLVSHDYAFKRSHLYLLADGCENLSCLWMLFSRSPKVDDMLYFLEKKKNILKELGLGMNLQDCILEKLKECHHLEVLLATDARFITDGGIKSFKNLPSLKYCALRRASFQPQTVLELVWAGSSSISTKFKILDLTGFRRSEHFFAMISENEDLMKAFRERNFVTFGNRDSAVGSSGYTNPSFHWMYRDTSFLEA